VYGRKAWGVMLTLLSVGVLESLKDGADNFTQLYPIRERRRTLALKEQIRLDNIVVSFKGPIIASKMFCQMKLVERWSFFMIESIGFLKLQHNSVLILGYRNTGKLMNFHQPADIIKVF
jgi:hypothetical protein